MTDRLTAIAYASVVMADMQVNTSKTFLNTHMGMHQIKASDAEAAAVEKKYTL